MPGLHFFQTNLSVTVGIELFKSLRMKVIELLSANHAIRIGIHGGKHFLHPLLMRLPRMCIVVCVGKRRAKYKASNCSKRTDSFIHAQLHS